jgi:DmsE family decaheme c-type cytochrome
MRLKTCLAALAAAALGAFASSPAFAQEAGDAVCAQCHSELAAGLASTKHGVKTYSATPAGMNRGCTACHGDVSAHLKDPIKAKPALQFTKGKGTPAAQTAACTSCHGADKQLTFWESGRHARNDVACSSCHSIHGRTKEPRISPFVTTQRTLEYETCNACHLQIRGQILKPSHHPIVEGKVTCSDCHNPHGALSPNMLKSETPNDQCLSCHTDKRGPFVFEHPAVADNCLSCHMPHGSAHNKLLAEKVPNLCQDCHDWSRHPGTMYSGKEGWPPIGTAANPSATANTRVIARSCLNCHNQVHGSNAPGNRGKFFLR